MEGVVSVRMLLEQDMLVVMGEEEVLVQFKVDESRCAERIFGRRLLCGLTKKSYDS
jgi:hypothetical protein